MSETERIVLGIDPGVAILGFGVLAASPSGARLVDCGAITTSRDHPHSLRLLELFDRLSAIIGASGASELAVEQLFFARNARTALAVGEARGVVLLAAAQGRLAISEYTPLQVKQAVAGYGGASKVQVQDMVRMRLGLDFVPSPDDVADAIAVGLCHLSWADYARPAASPAGGQPTTLAQVAASDIPTPPPAADGEGGAEGKR